MTWVLKLLWTFQKTPQENICDHKMVIHKQRQFRSQLALFLCSLPSKWNSLFLDSGAPSNSRRNEIIMK